MEQEVVGWGGGWICKGSELVRAWKWLRLARRGEKTGKTEARSVLSGQRGTRRLRERYGGRSCDGVTRNKSDSRLRRDLVARLQKQDAANATLCI